VTNNCVNDELSLLSGLAGGTTTIIISEPPTYSQSPIDFEPTWTNSVTGCPQEWILYELDSGNEVAFDPGLFTISELVSSKVTVYTEDTSTYNPPVTLTMRIY